EGESGSGVFLGEGKQGAQLLGVTRQLIGEKWLHAGPFRYCGSVGPWMLSDGEQATLENIARVLTRAADLRGLFGVDFVGRDGIPWPVEVNPRYTASIEVLEYASKLQALAWHRDAFNMPELPPIEPVIPSRKRSIIGKAIYYAPHTL